MIFPITFRVFNQDFNLHFIFETLGMFLGFRFYLWEKKKFPDFINSTNRLYSILGATIGALVGSRLVGSLENPSVFLSGNLMAIYENKTIIGGLFGGLLGVEIIKKMIGEKQSTGDLYILPLMIGIAVGRVGCFSMGIAENTFGDVTRFFTGMNLGDGLKRHPVSLYEILFLLILFPVFYFELKKQKLKSGVLFKIFLLMYFSFRFFIEFIKPHDFLFHGISTIQITCILLSVYYFFETKFFIKL